MGLIVVIGIVYGIILYMVGYKQGVKRGEIDEWTRQLRDMFDKVNEDEDSEI